MGNDGREEQFAEDVLGGAVREHIPPVHELSLPEVRGLARRNVIFCFPIHGLPFSFDLPLRYNARRFTQRDRIVAG